MLLAALHKVLYELNGIKHVEGILNRLGMPQELSKAVGVILVLVNRLLTSGDVAQILGELHINPNLPSLLPSEDGVVQLLYAYLVQWIGMFY